MFLKKSSLLGKINIVKTLALFKLIYNAAVLNLPKDFAKKVNETIFKFVWSYKPDKIKRKTLIRPIPYGGLNMVDFNMVEKSIKASWVKRLANNSNSNRKATFLEATKSIGGSLIFLL